MTRPCPCCGNAKLYEGATSAVTQGVQCLKCGLKIERELPGRWPRGTSRMHPDARLREAEQQTLNRSRKAWNRRVEAQI